MINQTLIIFLMLIIGIAASKLKFLTKKISDNIGTVLVNICLPCSVISAAKVDEILSAGFNVALVLIITAAYYIFGIVSTNILSKPLKLQDKRKAIFVNNCVFANTSFLGIPICQTLFGNTGAFYASIANLLYYIFMWTYGIMAYSGSKKFNLKELAKVPAAIACVILILLIVFKISLPKVVIETCEIFGRANLPLSMLIISYSMSQTKIKELFNDKTMYLISFIRLIVFPLLVLFITRMLNIDRTVALVCTVLCGCPSASMNVVLSTKYNCDGEYSAKSVVQTMMLFIITMPIVIFVSELLYS